MTGILAIDPGRRSGWAFARPGQQPEWGAVEAARKGCAYGALFSGTYRWLDPMLTMYRPEIVVYTAPIVIWRDTADTLQRLNGITAVINLCVALRSDRDLPGLTIRNAQDKTVSVFFTGMQTWPNRDAKKKATMDTCRLNGWDVGDDDDAADALALLVYTEAKLGLASRTVTRSLVLANPKPRRLSRAA